MSSPTHIGRSAEQLAAGHLETQGFLVLDRNWRNRWCELDLVARRGSVVHIIEVKYRRSSAWGSPAEYINRDKSQRLRRAALAWVQAHRHNGPYQIDLVSVEGELTAPKITVTPKILEY